MVNKALELYHLGKEKEAFSILLEEAKKENEDSYYLLGQFYYQGIGCNQNYSEAYRYFSKSKDLRAIYNVGLAHELGLGTYQDNKKAFLAYEKAKELKEAKYSLALCYFDGIGTEKRKKDG